MSKQLTRQMLDDTLPPGDAWTPEEEKDLDLLLDGIADGYESQRASLDGLSDVRNPNKTAILSDLEREHGIPTNTLLSEATRRVRLAELVYGRDSDGTEDDLQTALRNVGFDVYVYQNDPAVDPDIFLNQSFIMVAGGGNAYAGRADAFAGRTGGELLVNGDIFKTTKIFTSVAGTLYAGTDNGAGEYEDLLIEKIEYNVPDDPNDWPLVFFVGGDVTRELYWDVYTASYDNVSFSVNSEDTDPTGMFFKSDGTKMYVIGIASDSVYQYTLSTPWDMTTASYDSVSFSVNSEDVAPTGMFFKSDGTKMYVIGIASDSVYQYTLSTPWDMTTASYDSVSFSVNAQDVNPRGVFFKSDGTKMYVIGGGNDSVYQYTLSTPWDMTTASYDNVSFSVNAQETSPTGMFFKSDGTKMYVIGTIADSVYQYTLSTPWDMTTASYDNVSFSVNAQETSPTGMFFKSDGTKMYVIGFASDSVHQYTLDESENGPIIDIDNATVDGTREDEFKRIILQYKPLHAWAALIVTYA